MRFEKTCYAVKIKRDNDIHVMQDDYFGTGSTPSGLLAPPKKTLCGQKAVRNVGDVFAPGEATCMECSRRYDAIVLAES